MKRIIISTLLLTNAYSLLLAFTGSVSLTQRLFLANTTVIQRSQQAFQNIADSYVNGGYVFTYDVGLFSNPPIVLVSVGLNGSSDPNSTYVAVVSANSAVSSTITIYRIPLVGGALVEANTGEVDLFIWSVAND